MPSEMPGEKRCVAPHRKKGPNMQGAIDTAKETPMAMVIMEKTMAMEPAMALAAAEVMAMDEGKKPIRTYNNIGSLKRQEDNK